MVTGTRPFQGETPGQHRWRDLERRAIANVARPAPNAGGSVISPDGQSVAFVAVANGAPRLWIRDLDPLTARELSDTDGAKLPFWSPDSRSIGFFTSIDLRRIDATFGVGAVILARALDARGGAWNADGTIVFSPNAVGRFIRSIPQLKPDTTYRYACDLAPAEACELLSTYFLL